MDNFFNLPIDALFYVYLGIGAILIFIFGYFVSKKRKNANEGFFLIAFFSAILFFSVLIWFDAASKELFMGTMPWLANMVFGGFLLLIYLVVAWFILKRKIVN